MYVDNSRIKDLEYLQAELDKPINVKPLLNQEIEYQRALDAEVTRKKQIRRNIEKIQQQMKDPKLAVMRERLRLAHFYSDKEYIWKYTNQIKEYLKEPLIEEGTM